MTSPHAATVAVARQLLAQLGVSLADLRAHDNTTTAGLPTLSKYLHHFRAAAGPGANRTYGTYWDRMLSRRQRVCRKRHDHALQETRPP